MADAFTIKFDFDAVGDKLDAITTAAKEQMRPAAQAGAQILYDEVKLRAPVAKRARKAKSGRTIEPGALKASIYQVFSADNSSDDHATYHVSWNYKKAPHGHLVEFGTSRAPAHPFLRPSFDTRANDALRAAESRMVDGLKPVLAP